MGADSGGFARTGEEDAPPGPHGAEPRHEAAALLRHGAPGRHRDAPAGSGRAGPGPGRNRWPADASGAIGTAAGCPYGPDDFDGLDDLDDLGERS
ncbi:hypothetical protein EAO72_37300 [Streptomyces sp. or43]|nr:hypothetical protein EAO72_37300 [Streptomyces sp. or43]